MPLYYENRIPELQLVNENLGEEIADIVESALLDEDQQAKLEREFAREYHLITREERLEKVAEDIVAHYSGRGVLAQGDGHHHRQGHGGQDVRQGSEALEGEAGRAAEGLWPTADPADKPELERRLSFFEKTDMAVVVSQSQNEIEEFKKKGLDIEHSPASAW